MPDNPELHDFCGDCWEPMSRHKPGPPTPPDYQTGERGVCNRPTPATAQNLKLLIASRDQFRREANILRRVGGDLWKSINRVRQEWDRVTDEGSHG